MKKALVFLLMIAMVATLFSGCSNNSGGPDSSAYPKETITILVPFSAGGGADLMARALQSGLQEKLGVSVVVENKTGANGGIAMAALANSKADGYTIILTTTGPSTIAPNISDIGYTNENFAPICQLADLPTGLAVHKNSGITTLDQLFEVAEANFGKMTYGSSGAGSTHNLAVEGLLMAMDKGGMLTHVSFEGGSQAATALLGQQVDLSANILTELVPYKDSGDFVVLGIASGNRSSIDPNVPTFKEQGYDTEQSTWYGMAAPAGTPKEIIEKLDATIKELLEDPATIEVFNNIKTPIDYLGHAEFKEKWDRLFINNAELVEELGLN